MRAESSIRAAHLQIGAKNAVKIDFLKSLPSLHRAGDIADEQDHGLRILMRDMHPDAGIRGARSARDEGDAGTSGHRAIGAGHERRAAFLTAGHDIDRALIDAAHPAPAGNFPPGR